MRIEAIIGAGAGPQRDPRLDRMARGLLHSLRDRVARGGDLRAEVRNTLARAAGLRATLAELGPAAGGGDVEALVARGIVGSYGEAGIEALAGQGYGQG